MRVDRSEKEGRKIGLEKKIHLSFLFCFSGFFLGQKRNGVTVAKVFLSFPPKMGEMSATKKSVQFSFSDVL